jgi:hypothetical protein
LAVLNRQYHAAALLYRHVRRQPQLIIVKPKQRFLDWIHSWDSDRRKLEDIRIDPTAYLISQEYDVLNEQREILESVHSAIFEEELFAWYTGEELWPAQRDLKTVLEWFDVEFHSLIFDLVTDIPLEQTEYELDLPGADEANINSNGH